MIMTYVVRVVLIFPFVILCAAIWAVVGLFFWIPTFIFAMAEYQYAIFRHLMTGRNQNSEMELIRTAGEYYSGGFSIILGVLRQRDDFKDPSSRSLDAVPSLWDDFKGVIVPFARKLTTTSLAWLGAAAAWYYVFGSFDFFARLAARIQS